MQIRVHLLESRRAQQLPRQGGVLRGGPAPLRDPAQEVQAGQHPEPPHLPGRGPAGEPVPEGRGLERRALPEQEGGALRDGSRTVKRIFKHF